MAELHDIYLDSIPIAEMDAGAEDYVPLDPKIVNRLKSELDDENPQFPVVMVESGISKNKFEWTPEILESVAEQVNANQPVGYLGHIRPEDEKWLLPAPQTWWLKAIVRKEGDKAKLYVKGYNLPDEPIRKYNKVGVVNSVSWHGKAAVQHMKGGIQRVREFTVDSIDWSRKGKSAMSARLVTVAAEMEGKEEDQVAEIGKMTPAELKAEAPNLYTLIVNESQGENEEKIEKLEEQVKEAGDAATMFSKIREILHIDEKADVLEAVVAVQKKLDEIGKKNVMERLSAILTEKIKDEDARGVVARLMPISEMEDLGDDDLKKKVNETMEKDESIKAIVNRLAGSAAPLKHGVAEMEGGGNGRYDSGKSTGAVKVTRTKL